MTVNTLSKELDAGWADKLWWGLPQISYWDFAGQLEYSAAHDFFMSSKQAVFVIIFSVMEDRASQCQQVSYWLKTVLSRSPKHVRILIVGTKIDCIDASKFQQTLDAIRLDMSSVVRCCCDASIVSVTKILFVTSMGNHPQYSVFRNAFKKILYTCCTQIFAGRDRLLRFPDEYQQMLADVEKLKELKEQGIEKCVLPIVRLKDISEKGAFRQLHNSHANHQKLQALRVLHDVGALILYEIEEAGERLHSICWEPQIVADIIAAFADPQSEVLSESHHSARLGRACFLLPDLLAFLEKNLPNYRDDRSVAEAMADYSKERGKAVAVEEPSSFGSKSQTFSAFLERSLPNLEKLFKFLQALGIFVAVFATTSTTPDEAAVPALDTDCVFMVPPALKGRPSFWREIADPDGNDTWVRGLRFSSTAGLVTVACFVRVMSAVCVVPSRMWGCAFVLLVDDDTRVLVRLSESRASVDTVIMSRSSSNLISENVLERCREIARLLDCNHTAPLLLCPYCCASDMYVRSGSAHSFYENQALTATRTSYSSLVSQRQSSERVLSAPVPNFDALLSELKAHSSQSSDHQPAAASPHDAPTPSRTEIDGSVRRCSRYHDLRLRQLKSGILVRSLGSATAMPPLYPSLDKNNDGLDWMNVTDMGLLEVSRDDGGTHLEVLPNSFFCLTQQLTEGDELSVASAAAFTKALAERSASGPAVCSVLMLRKGTQASGTRQIQLRFSVGDTLPQSPSNPIQVHCIDMILACSCSVVIREVNTADGTVTTTARHGLEPGERVMLSVRFDSDSSVVEGILCCVAHVASQNQLSLSRAAAASDSGPSKALPLRAGVTLIPLRTSFTPLDNVLVVYKRLLPTDRRAKFAVFPGVVGSLKIARMAPKDSISNAACAVYWREVEDNWAIMLGSEFQNYELTRVTLFHNAEREQLFLTEVQRLKDAASQRPPPDFASDSSGKDRADINIDLQKQIMGHFKDFSQKFSLLPPGECTDVNAIVAWWGNWPSVYHTVAQNGFWNLPMHLKLDPGYFGGDGFYLSRFPRYNDYYLSGCSLAPQSIGDGNILMYARACLSQLSLHLTCVKSGATLPLEGRIP